MAKKRGKGQDVAVVTKQKPEIFIPAQLQPSQPQADLDEEGSESDYDYHTVEDINVDFQKVSLENLDTENDFYSIPIPKIITPAGLVLDEFEDLPEPSRAMINLLLEHTSKASIQIKRANATVNQHSREPERPVSTQAKPSTQRHSLEDMLDDLLDS